MRFAQELEVALRVHQAHVTLAVVARLDHCVAVRVDSRLERIEPLGYVG